MKTTRRLRFLFRLLNTLDEADYKVGKIDGRFKYTRRLVYNPNWIEFNHIFFFVLRIEPKLLLTTRKVNWDDFSTLIQDKRKLETILDYGIQYIQIPSSSGYQMVIHYIPDLLRTSGLLTSNTSTNQTISTNNAV